MTTPKSLPARPSLESLRKQAKRLARDTAAGSAEAAARVAAQLPELGRSLSLRSAQLVIAREHGFAGWRDLEAEVLKRSEGGLEWAFAEARRAIHDKDVGRLAQLIEEHPALLSEQRGLGAALVAATIPFLKDAAAHQETQTRPECLLLLIDAGAPIGADVWDQVISTRSAPMLELLRAKGVLPDTLAIRAALGDLETVRACFDASGVLQRSACSPGKGALSSLNEAFLHACRNRHEAVAACLLEHCVALEPELARRIDDWQGRAAFLAYMCEHSPPVVQDGAESLPPWLVFVVHQLERSMNEDDLSTFRGWLEREAYLLGEPFSRAQVRLIEHAAGGNRGRFIEELMALAPALSPRRPPLPCRAVTYAVEYGHAQLVPLLTRVWPLPDDLPHAAGVGDFAKVRRWFDASGQPALNNPLDHYPGAGVHGQTGLMWADNHVQQVLDVALAWACINHQFEIASFLLERGADIDTRWGTHEPASILHECAMSGNYEAAQFLIDRGIDMTLLDYRYRASAEGWARYGARDEPMARFLAAAAAARRPAPGS